MGGGLMRTDNFGFRIVSLGVFFFSHLITVLRLLSSVQYLTIFTSISTSV